MIVRSPYADGFREAFVAFLDLPLTLVSNSRKNDENIFITRMYDIPVGLQPNIVLLQAARSPTHNH